jgi:hypothetical protein
MMARKKPKKKIGGFFLKKEKERKKVIHYIHIVWPRKKKTRRNEANAAGEMHHVVLHSVCVCVCVYRPKERELPVFSSGTPVHKKSCPEREKKPTPRTYNSFFLPLKNPAYTTHNYRILRRFIYFFGEREKRPDTPSNPGPRGR